MRKLLALLMLSTAVSCQRVSQDPFKKIELLTPSGDTIETTLAITMADQTQGLSGVQDKDFKEDQGMLFYYMEDSEKAFWMPDTYFDLDLIFMDKDLKVLDIVRKVPHYVGRANPDLIPKVRSVWARHTLELKAASEISKRLKVGDVLTWKSSLTMGETEAKIKEKGMN
ncbi:MAG TPA: DUF192 domain-containing protein [Bacteriovoracaceae bacterium]|nr:DUF192 domain-containing protein [Bacteriovoracaceae bacterium]